MLASLARQDLRAVEVAPVGNDIEALCLERVFRLLGHAGELRPVVADIGHLVRDDQMMLGVDGHLATPGMTSRSLPCSKNPTYCAARSSTVPDERREPPKPDESERRPDGGSGGSDGGTPPRHPLIEGMFQSLPPNGQTWTLDEAADWLHAAAYNLRFAYKLKGKIKIEIEVEHQAGE
jgi:hypothetical protein